VSTSVELHGIVKRFGGHEVIRGVDLSIEPGAFTVFVGPSGCGKSTLLRMIAGLEPISDGDLIIDGRRMNDVEPSKRSIAMVFQSYALYPHLTVYKNLAFGLENAGHKRAEIDLRVQRVANALKIEPLLKRRPKALSGGQRQRVAIGRAIVRDPKIFLLDEPLSNLDAELRVQMRVEISKLHQELGNTMIYVTHDQVEAMTMAAKIVVLRDGNVVQVGTPLEIYNHPKDIFVAGFIGSPRMNLFSVRPAPAADGIQFAGGTVRLETPLSAVESEAPITFGVRPEHIMVGGEAGQPLCEARVYLVEHLGGATVIYATAPDGNNLTVTAPGQAGIHHGDLIPLRVHPALCHLFRQNGTALPNTNTHP